MTHSRRATMFAWTGALVCALFFGLPLSWVVLGAISHSSDVAAGRDIISGGTLSFGSFSSLFSDHRFIAQFWNSIVCAASCATAAVTIGCYVGYVSARRRQVLAQVLARFSLIMYMISPVVLAIPFFILWTWLDLANSIIGLVLAHLSFAIPYSIWSMRGFFADLPRTLEERAATEGLSPTGTLLRVVLPAVAPGAVATFLFCFLLSWNDYVFARVLIGTDSLKTLTVGIDDMFHGSLVDWGQVLAAGTVTMVPAIIIVVALQKQLSRGAMVSWR